MSRRHPRSTAPRVARTRRRAERRLGAGPADAGHLQARARPERAPPAHLPRVRLHRRARRERGVGRAPPPRAARSGARLDRERAPGKFVNLAVFDVVFQGSLPSRPLATLAWKDWTGEPVIAFPRRPQRAPRGPDAPRPPPSFPAPAPTPSAPPSRPRRRPPQRPSPCPRRPPAAVVSSPGARRGESVRRVLSGPSAATRSPLAALRSRQACRYRSRRASPVPVPPGVPVPAFGAPAPPALAPAAAAQSAPPLGNAALIAAVAPSHVPPMAAPAPTPPVPPPPPAAFAPPVPRPPPAPRSSPPPPERLRHPKPRPSASPPPVRARRSGRYRRAARHGRRAHREPLRSDARASLHARRHRGGRLRPVARARDDPVAVGLLHLYDIDRREYVDRVRRGTGAETLLNRRIAESEPLFVERHAQAPRTRLRRRARPKRAPQAPSASWSSAAPSASSCRRS